MPCASAVDTLVIRHVSNTDLQKLFNPKTRLPPAVTLEAKISGFVNVVWPVGCTNDVEFSIGTIHSDLADSVRNIKVLGSTVLRRSRSNSLQFRLEELDKEIPNPIEPFGTTIALSLEEGESLFYSFRPGLASSWPTVELPQRDNTEKIAVEDFFTLQIFNDYSAISGEIRAPPKLGSLMYLWMGVSYAAIFVVSIILLFRCH